MKMISKLIAVSALAVSSAAAVAQVSLEATSGSGDPGDPVQIFVDLTGDGSTNAQSWYVTYPTDLISSVDAAQCGASNPDISSDTGVNCAASCGTVNPGPGLSCVLYILNPTSLLTPAAIATTQLGPIEFTIDSTAPPGTTIDLGFFQPDPAATTTGGTITVNAPAGGFYGSNPVPGAELDFGFADIGQPTTTSFTVTNASADDFDVTGFASVPAEISTPGGTFTVPGSGSFEFTGNDAIVCNPDTLGPNTGTFEVEHDAAGGAGSPVEYSYTCLGQAPNVQVSETTITLNGVINGPAPTATFDITNASTAAPNTTSAAQNAALAEESVAEIAITTGLADNTISVDETDTVTIECTTDTADSFTETISLTYDDPQPDGTPEPAQIDVTVNCEIANAFPVYESVPTPGSALAFGPITNGTTSSPLGVDVGNSGAVGGADLDVTNVEIAGTDAAQFDLTWSAFTVPAGDGPDGTNDFTVTCSPDSVDSFTADLIVDTNDPDQPSGGFTYPLTCEGTSDAVFTSDPDPLGTLNLGVVPPGSTTPEGFIDFNNEGTFDPLDVDCTVTDDEDVFTFTPETISFTIQPGGTESVGFQCTPPTPGSFTATVQCDITGTVGPISTGYDVVCQGQPLVVPTLDRWALLLMALAVLGIGGLAGRRMMA